MCFAPQRRALFRHRNFQKWSERGVVCTFWLGNVLRATTACTFSTLQLPKVVRQNVFCTFWLGNVLRATTASTFSTSQLPKVVRSWCVLYSYDLEMCFAPQRRQLFRHLNCQKWSGAGVFCTVMTWKCASRHNGVHFSSLIRWLRTRRFSEPTFQPSRATNHWKKHSESRLSYLFAHLHLLSSDSFSSLTFSLLWLCPSLLFICPYCRKFDF